MNAVIATPVDTPTELLAPTATAQGSGRVSAGDFDLLVALLQASLGARSGTTAGGGPAPDALAEELPVTGEKPTTTTLASLTLAAPTSTRVPSPDADAAERLDADAEDEPQALQGVAPPASLALVLAMTPVPGAVTTPTPPTPATAPPTITDLARDAAQSLAPTAAPRFDGMPGDVAPGTPTRAQAPGPGFAEQVMTRAPVEPNATPATLTATPAVMPPATPTATPAARPPATPTATPAARPPATLTATPAARPPATPTAAPAAMPPTTLTATPVATPASTPVEPSPPAVAAEPTTDAEAPIAAATSAIVDPRPRPAGSARTADVPRGRDGAPSEIDSDGVLQHPSADTASRVMRAAPGRDDQPGSQERESPDGEGAPSPSDSGIARPSAPAASATLRPASDAAASARPEPVHDPVDQIATRLRDVRTDGRHEISLRLDPPDLGTVRIDARLEGARLQVQIHAEQATTGEALADALPRLREALSQQGFVPSEISVHLGLDASGRQFARDSAPTFTPPRDGEPSPQPQVVRAPARAVALSDGLDVWA